MAPHRAIHQVMGTVASLHIHDTAPAESLAVATSAVFAELDRLEAMFSTFRPDSEISRLNRGELSIAECGEEVVDVLDACTWLEHQSSRAFRIEPPARPGQLDPAGFVKGWAAERSTRLLREAGLGDWYLSVGGDIQTSGRPEPGALWTVAIADPFNAGGVLTTLPIPVNGAIATSGTAERGEHMWRAMGSCAEGSAGIAAGTSAATDDVAVVSVTVIGPHLTWADAFATTAFAMGPAGLTWLARYPAYQGWAVRSDGVVLTSPTSASDSARPRRL